jgi:hypothetical protein
MRIQRRHQHRTIFKRLSDALFVGLNPNSAAIAERPARVGEDLDRRQDVVQHDGLPTTPLLFSWPYALPVSDG